MILLFRNRFASKIKFDDLDDNQRMRFFEVENKRIANNKTAFAAIMAAMITAGSLFGVRHLELQRIEKPECNIPIGIQDDIKNITNELKIIREDLDYGL